MYSRFLFDSPVDTSVPLLPGLLTARNRNRGAKHQPLWSQLPTDWPRVGGRDSSPYRSAGALPRTPDYVPVSDRAIYVAASPGARDLALRAGFPIYKIGCCDPDRVGQRMDEHNAARYGSAYLAGSDIRHEPAWDRWFQSIVQFGDALPLSGPIRRCGKSMIVGLPPGLSAEQFDAQFDRQLRKGAIDRWSMTDEGRDHCAVMGLNPEMLRRFSAYPGGTDTRLSRAGELVAFNPRWVSHAEILARIVHRIIEQHLQSGVTSRALAPTTSAPITTRRAP